MCKYKKQVILLGTIFALGVVFAICFNYNTVKALGTDYPDNIVMTWQENPQNTITIAWRTAAHIVGGEVQYLECKKYISSGSFEGYECVSACDEEFDTNLGAVKLHVVNIKDLQPETLYAYRVGSKGKFSEISFFRTAALDEKTPFSFLVFGDSQSYDYSVWGKTLTKAFSGNEQTAFFMNVGDLVDRGQDCREWNAWFAAGKDILRKIPFMPVVGNHETYTASGGLSLPTYFKAQFKVPQNGPEGLKGQVYSFDYGDAHFVVLDSQISELQGLVPDMLATQIKWLELDLSATDKKWKFVFLHRPIYSNQEDGNKVLRKSFAGIMQKYHVDVVFTAHEHVYARTHPMYNGIGLANDGERQGVIYVPTGRSGTKYYAKGSAMWWNQFFYNPTDEPNYIVVNVSDKLLIVTVYKQSGVKVDEWQVESRK